MHEAHALPDQHSLHVTISAYQQCHWGKFLELAVQGAFAEAYDRDVAFREGLPLRWLDFMGVANADDDDDDDEGHGGAGKSKSKGPHASERAKFQATARRLISKLADYAPLDAAADQMGAEFIHSCAWCSFVCTKSSFAMSDIAVRSPLLLSFLELILSRDC